MNYPEHRDGSYLFSPIGDDHEPSPFPFWPFALCVGFPFLVALVIWLVCTFLKGS
jgi:hypothetical protein